MQKQTHSPVGEYFAVSVVVVSASALPWVLWWWLGDSKDVAFFEGPSNYDRWNFFLAMFGASVGIAGFIIAGYAALKAKGAADASRQTAAQISTLDAMLNLNMLSRWCLDISNAIGSKNYELAQVRLRDVQTGLTQLLAVQHVAGLQKPKKWSELQKSLDSVQVVLLGTRVSQPEGIDHAALGTSERHIHAVYLTLVRLAQQVKPDLGIQ